MFALGPMELLVLFVYPFSGIAAAIYLAVALRNNAERGHRQP
jgi:hypothetical protein